MEDYGQERRGIFDGLKVPALDVNAIFLAAVALVVFVAGIELVFKLGNLPTTEYGVCVLYSNLASHARGVSPEPALSLMHYLGCFAWAAVVWAYFSAALNRIAAMKLAREESVEIIEALKFAGSKFISNLFTLVFIIGLIGVLYTVCNTSIAGSIGAIPYFGDVVLGLLFFMVLISTFLIVFVLAVGLLGFNLSSSAIATEVSDTFDGVSRSWNYILSRPWGFLLCNALIVGYISLFLFFGGIFVELSIGSLSSGSWGLGSTTVQFEAGPEASALLGDSPEAATFGKGGKIPLTLPGKGEYLLNRIVKRDASYTGAYTDSLQSDGSRIKVFKRQYLQLQEDGRAIDVLPAIKNLGWFYYTGEVLNGWVLICQLIIYAYALNYFFAGQTTIYFLLRKEVDGDDYTEIILGDEDDEDPFDLPTQPPSPGTPGSGGGGDDNKGKSLPMVMEV